MKFLKFISVATISLLMLIILLCLNLIIIARFSILSDKFVNKKMDALQYAFIVENNGTFSYNLEEETITTSLTKVLNNTELEWLNNEWVEGRREIISFILGGAEKLPTLNITPLKSMIPKVLKTALFEKMDIKDNVETFKEIVQAEILQPHMDNGKLFEQKDIKFPSIDNNTFFEDELFFAKEDPFFSKEFIAFTLDKKDALASGEFSYEELLIECLTDMTVNGFKMNQLNNTIDFNQLYTQIKQTTTDPLYAIQTLSQSLTQSILYLCLLVALCGLLLFFIFNKISTPLYIIASEILIISLCSIALNAMTFALTKSIFINLGTTMNNTLSSLLTNFLLYLILIQLFLGVILPIVAIICVYLVKAQHIKRKSLTPPNDMVPKTLLLPTNIRWIGSFVVCVSLYLILSNEVNTYKSVFKDIQYTFSNFEYSFEKSDVIYNAPPTKKLS